MQEMQTTLPVGSIVGDRYQIEALLGKGGFGAVYLVRDLRVRQNVFALKEVIDPDQRERRHFTLEAEFLKRADHPSLPRVYRVFDDPVQNRAYMLMDYVEGVNLERLRRERPGQRLPLDEVLMLIQPIVEAIAYLHAQTPPIIHRDIKPSNIIAPTSGGPAVLVDLGIAKEFDQDATTTAIRHASPGYGAPEQYSTGTNTRTDIYGLGATVYTLLTGMVPVDAFFRLTQHLSKNTDPLVPVKQLVPDIPDHVSAALERALALENSERFATVRDFWKALQIDQLDTFPARAVASVAAAVRVIPGDNKGPARARMVNRSGSGGGWAAILLLILLALGVGFASALLLFPGLHGQPARSSTATAAGPTATHTAVPYPSPSPLPTQAPSPTATSAPASGFPSLASVYSGTIHDNNGNIDTSMSLNEIIQRQQHIQGNFVVSPPLSGSGPFTGSVTPGGFIQFTIHSPEAPAPLYFSGTIQKNGNISGTYCSLDTKGHCNPAVGGYGSWSVQPVGAGSI
jgi:serine/threonine protein kinase